MKICLLTHTFPRFNGDSAAPFMDGVAESLCQKNNEVFVLTPYSPLFKNIERKPYKIITYKYILPKCLHLLGYSKTLTNDKKIPLVNLLISPLLYLFGFIALLRLIKKEKIDLISAHWILPNGFIASVASLLTGIPVVSTLPGSDVYMAQKNLVFKLMVRFAAFISKGITSNSPELLHDLQQLGVDSKKFSTIIYGVDPFKFYPNYKNRQDLRKRLNIVEDAIIILSVGRLVEKKGFKYLVEAASLILQKNKEVIFVIIGDGDQQKELEDLIEKKGLTNNFYLLGDINYQKLPDYYNMADIFILPSIRDSKGNLDDQSVAVIEAMACGLPVVTTNFLGYRVVIKNKMSGFLLPPKNILRISQTLNNLILSRNLREKIGKQARINVLKKFSWQIIGYEYLQLFNLISKKEDYYSRYVPKIFNKISRQKIGRQIIGVFKKYIGNTRNLTCLDIGCSNGVVSNLLSQKFKSVVGVDIDQEAIGLAQKNYNKKNLNFKVMDAQKMMFKNNQFDVVILNQIYEFVPNPQELVNEVYRVLKKDGVCFVGARNKLAIIEGQSGLPLVHLLPNYLSQKIALLLKSEYYPPQYKTLSDIKKLFNQFKIDNLTVPILKNSQQYNFTSLLKYRTFLKFVPRWLLKSLINLIPNYILICKKV